METNSVYVRNLPWRTTADDLVAALEAQGLGKVVDARIIQDPDTGLSQGYGFVDCADADGRDRVCRALDGLELGGRRLTAEPARPRQAMDRGIRG